MSRIFPRLAPVALLVFATIGCGGGGDKSTVTEPVPNAPAPSALQGVWGTTLTGSGDPVTLTLGATSYQINRGVNEASGAIAVAGDRINFSRSSVCSGLGSYRWAITGTSLLLTAIAPDACPGRSEVLAGYTYTRSG